MFREYFRVGIMGIMDIIHNGIMGIMDIMA
jgi:hypothetical protein